MAWISVHESVLGHKLRGLKKRANCSECEALGILVKIWLWGLNNADKEGCLLNTSKEDISELISGSLSSKLKPDFIIDALIGDGWIDEVNGELYMHDWSEWQSFWYDYRERKEKDRKRKQKNSGNSMEVPQIFHVNSMENEPLNFSKSNGISKDIPEEIPRKFHGISKDVPEDIPRNFQRNQTEPNQTEPKPKTEKTTTTAPDGACEAEAGLIDLVPYKRIMESYNSVCTRLRKIKGIDGERKKAVTARFKKYGLDAFLTLFKKANSSDFLCGGGSKSWSADFDWLMNATNIAKVLEGKYDDRENPTGKPSGNIFFDYARGLDDEIKVPVYD